MHAEEDEIENDPFIRSILAFIGLYADDVDLPFFSSPLVSEHTTRKLRSQTRDVLLRSSHRGCPYARLLPTTRTRATSRFMRYGPV